MAKLDEKIVRTAIINKALKIGLPEALRILNEDGLEAFLEA